LHREKDSIAFRWLSGSTNLFDEELKEIEQRDPLPEEAALPLLSLLGKANILSYTPIVLVLDQLDLMTKKDLIDEFQYLLFGLINNSKNWYVIVSLIQNKFDIWRQYLSGALQNRIMQNGQLPIVELQPLNNTQQKRELIAQRLDLPHLIQLREKYRIPDPLFPFKEADIEDLVSDASIYPSPRELICKASERYLKLIGEPSPKHSLGTEIETTFETVRSALNDQGLLVDNLVDRWSLAARLAELIEVVCVAKGWTFESSSGPLDCSHNFKGTDTILKIDGREVRLLGHHIHQGAQFPNFLSSVIRFPPTTILVRDGEVPVRGSATLQRLAEFKKDKTFIHLPRSEIADAEALGKVLAEMREGNFNVLSTDPDPTPENIMRCLGQISRLAQSQLAQKVFELIDDKAKPVKPTDLSPVSKPPSPSFIQAVRTIMQSARWLVFERLHRQLKISHQLDISEKGLRDAIATPPLRNELLCYPQDIHASAGIHILIWSVE
jgi:hypothetical protein